MHGTARRGLGLTADRRTRRLHLIWWVPKTRWNEDSIRSTKPRMGYLRASFVAVTALGLVACGSKEKAKPDAPMPDAPIDAKPIDAPPDEPMFDLSCAGNPLPTTADDPVTAAGTTEQITLSGPSALGMADVSVFKVGQAQPLKTVQSDMTTGAYATGDLVTGGVPLNAYLKGSHAD